MGDSNKVPVAEIAKHSSAEDCWVVVNGKVYDLSKVGQSLSARQDGDELMFPVRPRTSRRS